VNLLAEIALVNKLVSLEVTKQRFDVNASYEARREQTRVFVRLIPDVTFTVRDGKRITMAEQFRLVYGEVP